MLITIASYALYIGFLLLAAYVRFRWFYSEAPMPPNFKPSKRRKAKGWL